LLPCDWVAITPRLLPFVLGEAAISRITRGWRPFVVMMAWAFLLRRAVSACHYEIVGAEDIGLFDRVAAPRCGASAYFLLRFWSSLSSTPHPGTGSRVS